MKRVLVILCWLLFPGVIMAQTVETGFLDRSVRSADQEHLYQIYVPRTYDAAVSWPVILFLHGSGERGDAGLVQTQVGLGAAIRYDPDRWPAIVVFPQAPPGATWSGDPGRVALRALDAACAEFNVDSQRVYLTGISLGGRGAWELALHNPDRFAAVVPICGFIDGFGRYPALVPTDVDDPYAYLARAIARLPVWIFHGGSDTVVPVTEAQRMAAALRDAGADVTYTELPDVGHNAWDAAYGSPDLSRWLFAQKRP